MNYNQNKPKLALLVLSCDAYNDLWDDFFNLRDRFWADCPYDWYLVTESQDYCRDNVKTILCGMELDWSSRLRYAVNTIDADYFGIFLEDYFIYKKVQNEIIDNLLHAMNENKITFINTADVFYNSINMKDKCYFQDHLIIIPNNKVYGISTESAIWEKQYLLSKLGSGNYSAWQFEIDRVNEAKSGEGLGGFNVCDDRMPFNVSILPVVIQGKIYPRARKFFKKNGYSFITQRKNMSLKQVFLYRLKVKFSKIKTGRKVMKWLATKILGIKFFT